MVRMPVSMFGYVNRKTLNDTGFVTDKRLPSINMIAYLKLPLAVLKFWYFEAPYAILALFDSLNHTFLQLFSLVLMVQTFFKPLKNEYRKGLVGFSIGMGMAVKTCIIVADLFLFFLLLTFEFATLLIFLIFPVVTIYILFM